MKMCVRAGAKVLAVAALVGAAGHAAAQTPATNVMTYQGKLQSGGQPYTGTADITIRVYNSDVGGSAIGTTNCWDHVQVQDGIFTLTFHPGAVLDGRALWLEIDVREDATIGNGCTGAFTTLFPRQRIAAAPLASALVLPAFEVGDVGGQPAISITNGSSVAGSSAIRGVAGGGSADTIALIGSNGSSGPGARGVVGELTSSTPGLFSSAVHGTVTSGLGSAGVGVMGVHSGSGTAVRGSSGLGIGVSGDGNMGVYGLGGSGTNPIGVRGATFVESGTGVEGTHNAVTGTAPGVRGTTNSAAASAIGVYGVVASASPGANSAGVVGVNQGTVETTDGVRGTHLGAGQGVFGVSFSGKGVRGEGPVAGVEGVAWPSAVASYGVRGTNSNALGIGVFGEHTATSGTAAGVVGATSSTAGNAVGVLGEVLPVAPGGFSAGVRGVNHGTGGNGVGVFAMHEGSGFGIYATTTGATGYAGYFQGRAFVSGNLQVGGTLSKGAGSFKIDHPLDPENKYLLHSFVESPDMMNIYNGVAMTDEKGYATVTMPDWFEALNQDFRYQLTVIDSADSDDFVLAKVVKEVEGNRFTLRASKGGVKVSWQVTGIRHDAFARDQRIPTEELKSESERGMFLYPQGFGFGEDRRVGRTPLDETPRQ
jgi:hypothetical protein